MTDKELLAMAYGAIATSTDDNLLVVKELIEKHLFVPPPILVDIDDDGNLKEVKT